MNDEQAFDPYNPNCPSRQLVDRIGDRWTVLIIGALASGPARYGELADSVAGISPRMLSQTLKALERDGLVAREAFAEIPPRVVYSLTPSGESLRPVLLAVETWARQHMPGVLAAREAFDAQQA
ncbi:winged helix-turn-helix transcriptional regulator [Leucobacter aridicollis]|uniref:DNA-binding HxlR family transcriptional regulator n=1 Tax=Leucobacter aridicollis TaxID=283878 RepID=A0A852R5T0_9MICO|nr:helix-turn-helix domain-containing protein [Leucobacter aridicollis]MBL3682403.1 transcriptional regulator [Leucobacter aridicollis]NYD25819.1 DNA-binding HxlR family transcriptional regulator [Leucobacter aridicollis]